MMLYSRKKRSIKLHIQGDYHNHELIEGLIILHAHSFNNNNNNIIIKRLSTACKKSNFL